MLPGKRPKLLLVCYRLRLDQEFRQFFKALVNLTKLFQHGGLSTIIAAFELLNPSCRIDDPLTTSCVKRMAIGTDFNGCFLAQSGHGLPRSTTGAVESGWFVFWMDSEFHYFLQKLFVHHVKKFFIVFKFFHLIE